MKKILIIAPHADDEILGCGGTIARLHKEGKEVNVLVMTNASNGAPELFSQDYIVSVRKEARTSHKLLGVKESFFAEFPAPGLNAYPEFKLSMEISRVINLLSPDTVFIPHPGDMHQDHKAVYRSALVAMRPQLAHKVRRILVYETLSETNWGPMNEKPFVPNCYIDVSDVFDKKIESFKCFKSQMKQNPHARCLEAIEALAKYRGATIGVDRAEAFFVERLLFLDDGDC